MKRKKVLLVLGKRLVRGNLTAEGRSRVEALIEMMPKLCAETTTVIFCGGKTVGQAVSEADAMFWYYQQLISQSQSRFSNLPILLENQSVNTVQNIQNAAALLIQSSFATSGDIIDVSLLSNDYHLARLIEIQTLLDEQGLLRLFQLHCAQADITANIPLDVEQHISVPYPHKGALAEAFLACDALTTYRVYLHGVKNRAFHRSLIEVQRQPLNIARKAIKQLLLMSLDDHSHAHIIQLSKAIEQTAFTYSFEEINVALGVIEPILTILKRRLDPESIELLCGKLK
ncbi:YdcF family protein [Vibrio sagamiensis]|uniref:DUF218 domain-containing protein n=1 Tax=Vibrio sagamiensis NBRC 104589 TaxID=1219064 RepID=A0A511QDH2_9VIBR|nr:YdcF family protein [Vibrio sagamiensis]PNQ54171.1 YdcF family protein [Vibrio agarivorans]GEM75236.1 hypothetical protein VSA01S_13480 [Vibrio sagamiensis NBRC 104589]